MQETEMKTKYVFLVSHRITLQKWWFPDTSRGPSPNSVRSPAAGGRSPTNQPEGFFFLLLLLLLSNRVIKKKKPTKM